MRRLMWSSAALLPVLGLTLAFSSAAGAQSGTAQVRSAGTAPGAAPGAGAEAAARAALRHLVIRPSGDQRAGGHAARPATGPVQALSFNWAGYVDDNTTGKTYDKAGGAWTQPAITCAAHINEIAAFTAGIDGYTSSSQEQAGTLAQCFQGAAHYYTWWQMAPSGGITMVGKTVAAGDKIAASVLRNGIAYTLSVTDSTTTGNNFSVKKTCATATCPDTSAEWIAQAPDSPRGDYPLPNFKTWRLTSATAKSASTVGKISTFPDDVLTMLDGSETYNLATTGSLNTVGNAFTVTWHNIY